MNKQVVVIGIALIFQTVALSGCITKCGKRQKGK
jgi:hypothetical protein